MCGIPWFKKDQEILLKIMLSVHRALAKAHASTCKDPPSCPPPHLPTYVSASLPSTYLPSQLPTATCTLNPKPLNPKP